MQMRALGLMVLVALFVVAGKPQAQPLADEPVIPRPIIQDNGPGTQTPLVMADSPTGSTTTTVDEVVPEAPRPALAKDKSGPSGTIKVPSTAREVCYLFESDDGGKPASVVVWRAVGEGTKFDPREVRERILLQNQQALAQKGVYALQGEYHVQRLSLTAQETSHVLDLLQQNTEGKALVGDATWKAKVGPTLKDVNYEAERSKELKKLAAQRAREAKKATKGSSPHKTPDAKTKSTVKSASADHRTPSHATAVRVAHARTHHRANKTLAHQ